MHHLQYFWVRQSDIIYLTLVHLSFVRASRDEFEYRMFKTKANATTFCPRAVLEVEDSPRGPHPLRTSRTVNRHHTLRHT